MSDDKPSAKSTRRVAILGPLAAGAAAGLAGTRIFSGSNEGVSDAKILAHLLRDLVQSKDAAYVADALRMIQKKDALKAVMDEFYLWENDEETSKQRDKTRGTTLRFLKESNTRAVAGQLTEAVSRESVVDVISIIRASMNNDILNESPAGKSLNAVLEKLPSREQDINR